MYKMQENVLQCTISADSWYGVFCATSRLPELPLSCRFLAHLLQLALLQLPSSDKPFHSPSLLCVFNSFLTWEPFSHWSHLGATGAPDCQLPPSPPSPFSSFLLPLLPPPPSSEKLLPQSLPSNSSKACLLEGLSPSLTTSITSAQLDRSHTDKIRWNNVEQLASCFASRSIKKSLWHSQPIYILASGRYNPQSEGSKNPTAFKKWLPCARRRIFKSGSNPSSFAGGTDGFLWKMLNQVWVCFFKIWISLSILLS